MNSLFKEFGNQNQYAGMIQQFQQFKKGFSGDPKAQVQQLIKSGRMSQQQFNQLAQMATAFQGMLK